MFSAIAVLHYFVNFCSSKICANFAGEFVIILLMKTITILVPCFNEEAALPLLYQSLVQVTDNQRVWGG